MLFIVICLTGFGTKEPEDEKLCKAMLILNNTHMRDLRYNIKVTQ